MDFNGLSQVIVESLTDKETFLSTNAIIIDCLSQLDKATPFPELHHYLYREMHRKASSWDLIWDPTTKQYIENPTTCKKDEKKC